MKARLDRKLLQQLYKTDANLWVDKNSNKLIVELHKLSYWKDDKIVQKLCDELNLNRKHNSYEKFIIIAPPKFYGRMQKHLDKHVTEFVHIPKDYTKCKPDQIAQHIYEHLYA